MMRWLLLCVLLTAVACGGRQSRIEAVEEGPTLLLYMGEDEARGVAFMEDMRVVLEANVDDPEQGVARMEALLRVNGDEMIALARRLDERFQSLSADERVLYTREWEAYMEPSFAAWRASMVTFRATSGDVGARMERMVELFDERYVADEAAVEQ